MYVAVYTDHNLLVKGRGAGQKQAKFGVSPVAPPPTVGGGRVGDLFAIAVSCCWREFSHCEPRGKRGFLAGIVSRAEASLTIRREREKSVHSRRAAAPFVFLP